MDIDISQAREHLAKDPLLGPLISSQPGLTVPGAWDRFETAIRIILGQQVTVKGASTLAGRITSKLGVPVPGLDEIGLGFLFPSAQRMAEADLTYMGVPRARAHALQSFARAVVDGSLDLYDARELPELISHLRQLPGIGPWTANMLAMRVFGHMDAFPLGDMGLRKAAAELVGVESLSDKSLKEMSRNWMPWRSLAFNYLLRSLPEPTPIGTR